ncbi:oxygenase MpaB family protein [Demequina oxidasica]|uniref:oxygenase MpaB family protein n=1 Tax=Demequina oxidasica TaxID=676199 RepID=UPI000AA9B782|nr:oxygenase MpaB family protein [Demequina oxidasica]
MTVAANPIERVRTRVGNALFTKIAGPGGYEARDRIHNTAGPRWFPPGSPMRRVHGDASTFVGGLRALLLQSLHPLAMAGVAGHSGYRGDPWGRLARTSTFLAFTTFGNADDAQEMVDRVRAVHDRVRGKAADGRPYRASDPHLLRWVHVAEADSFLRSYQNFGARPMTEADADLYVAQSGRVAAALGATDIPQTTAELAECIDGYRPELAATDEALDTVHFLLKEPPLPWAVRPGYQMLAAGSVALLPEWARHDLKVGRLGGPRIGRMQAAIATKAVRWGLGTAEHTHARPKY